MVVENLGAVAGSADDPLQQRFRVFGELAGELAGGGPQATSGP
ncbi:MAG TPA: hypothetical protein VFQ38_11750 [Longimicrobiales bacterium]|nr:hypothetical protein [Longimicrobiales bacterium]